MGRLEDRVILVTGGAHGLGRAYCEGLAREGARVVVADIDGRGAETVAETLSAGGKKPSRCRSMWPRPRPRNVWLRLPWHGLDAWTA
jgi:NAD(P)-dependent dehydrogenase (short-subunit alcohol dehydrogenase family)